MEIYERVRYLRKNVLKLSQTAFGERLGVSRSEINNIERNVLARPDQKLSLLKLIAREFNVREEWLLNGEEPMEAPPETFSLDAFCKERGASDLEIDFVKSYFTLSESTRAELMGNFYKIFLKHAKRTSAQRATQKNPHEMTREEAHALLDQQFDEEGAARKRATDEFSTSGPGSSDMATG